MKHRFLDTEGELLILKKIGLIEILCERGFLIFKNTGFAIITLSPDCRVHFNANLLIQNSVSTFGLKLTGLYQLKHVFTEQPFKAVWVYKINLITVRSTSILLFVSGIVVVYIALRRVKNSVRLAAPQLHELEKLNIPARDV